MIVGENLSFGTVFYVAAALSSFVTLDSVCLTKVSSIGAPDNMRAVVRESAVTREKVVSAQPRWAADRAGGPACLHTYMES